MFISVKLQKHTMCALMTQKRDLFWSEKKGIPHKSLKHESFQSISSIQSLIQCSVAMSTYYTTSDFGLALFMKSQVATFWAHLHCTVMHLCTTKYMTAVVKHSLVQANNKIAETYLPLPFFLCGAITTRDAPM